MANRYWVGGTASWDGTAGSKWALTSGGAGGQAEPTAADDVFFDAASGAVTVTTATSAAFCQNLTTTGFTGTLAGAIGIRINGSLTLNAGMTFTNTGTLSFTAVSGSLTITTAGKTVGGVSTAPFASSTATWTLQDALTSSAQITVGYGTFATNNFNVTANNLSSTSTNTRAISLGSSTMTLIGSASTFNASISTNLTVTGTGTISLTSASAKTFAGGGISTYPTINQGGAGALTITGSNGFANITNTYSATGATSILFTVGTTNSFTNWNASGSAGKLLTINTPTAAVHTLSKASGTVSADYLSITNSTATGGASWYAGANSTNVSGNTGWIFTAPPSTGNTSNFFLMFR